LSGLSTPEQTVQMSSAEPLNIDDVIINEDAEQLIALNTLVEDEGSAIAYTPAQSGEALIQQHLQLMYKINRRK
tara:strand:+ start:3528 stop:3749 length:222 start_codon:yes stop_codon:yes gene_type:complete